MMNQDEHALNSAMNSAMNNAQRIGIAIVQEENRILVGVRDDDAVLGGMHEFAGGKCNPDERATDCAVRECFEETGLRVRVLELINQTTHHYDHGIIDLSFFLCEPLPGQCQPLLGNFRWHDLDELPHLNFPAGNRAAIQTLLMRVAN